MSQLTDLRDEVLARLGTSDTTLSAKVEKWLDRAQKKIEGAGDWRFLEKSGTISAVDGTQEYSLASDFKRVIVVRCTTANYLGAIPETTLPELVVAVDDLTCSLTGSKNIPDYFYIYASKIGFYPVPDRSLAYTYYYYKKLADFTASTEIPAEFHEALIYYAVYLGYLEYENPDDAKIAMRDFADALLGLRRYYMTPSQSIAMSDGLR